MTLPEAPEKTSLPIEGTVPMMHDHHVVDPPSGAVSGTRLPGSGLSVEEVSHANWFEATRLAVSPEQAAFFSAPVVYWLAESRFEPHFRPMVITDGADLVGFLVYGIDPDDGEYWLITFMIDQRFQGRGLGREALNAFLDCFDAQHPYATLKLGHHPDNRIAAHLYESAGFEPTGERIGGEVIRARVRSSPTHAPWPQVGTGA